MAVVPDCLWKGVTVGGEMFETYVHKFKSPRVKKKKIYEM